jgi:hypothetical protein
VGQITWVPFQLVTQRTCQISKRKIESRGLMPSEANKRHASFKD